MVCQFTCIAIALAILFGFIGVPLIFWTVLAAGCLYGMQVSQTVWIVFGAVAALFNIYPLRAVVVSSIVMKTFEALKLLPKISEAEIAALNAGDVWVEKELFSGKPNFKKLIADTQMPKFSAEEKAFLDNQCEKLCSMIDDWKVWKEKDLSPEVWNYIKNERFLGMIIPKEYGGLGFSAYAHGEVIMKISTRSLSTAITVMVPNSLGPAELLIHYGTDEQKKYYLPRLAKGEEIPCFALTEPGAGSDAASIQASGVVFKDTDGQIKIRLNWNKRWITLAAISTTLGLAFRLRDPDNLLGKGVEPGITCALIPTKTPGISEPRRHDPLGVPFYNCPTRGENVVVPASAIIGGPEMAGKGWKMLMECLAAGRGISLPSQAGAAGKYVLEVASAHAAVRKQFGTSIGRFEGVAEALARITGYTYILNAARRYTLGGIDQGIKPPVVTAMAKYYFTEMQRKILNDGMDILGGSGISMGPKNLLAHGLRATPISITVEGANILTRTLIIFGQGALRAHPFAAKEVEALEKKDVQAFDRAFWGHVGHVFRNTVRTIVLTLTRGYAVLPYRGGVTAKYYRRLAWASARFALLADVAMGSLGGSLKAKGKTTGRFADILAWMYMASAVLKHFEDAGRPKDEEALVKWSLDYAFNEIQIAFDGLLGNFEVPVLGAIMRGPLRWCVSMNAIGKPPSDSLDFKLARLAQTPGGVRDRLAEGIFMPKSSASHPEPMADLQEAFRVSYSSEKIADKVFQAMRAKKLKKAPISVAMKEAVTQGIITADEAKTLERAEILRNQVIQVDDFGLEEYKRC